MRLWSLHPSRLDARGLVALWREALLAQKVLRGRTRGYRSHPQLDRFREQARPVEAIAAYLEGVAAEARRRGYSFDERKIGKARARGRIAVTRGQAAYERAHLLRKLAVRDPSACAAERRRSRARLHPLFRLVAGPVAAWERP
jgi:hypothetical protein